MKILLHLKQTQPPEWLSGNINAATKPLTVTLHGEDGRNVSGVPLAFLAADSILLKDILLTHGNEEKHVILVGVDVEIISFYVSLICTGSLKLDDESYAKKDEILKKLVDLLFLLQSQIKLDISDLGQPEEKKAEKGEILASTSKPSDPDQATTEKIKDGDGDVDSETEASGQVCNELRTEVTASEIEASASSRFSFTRDEKTLFSENCQNLKLIPEVKKALSNKRLDKKSAIKSHLKEIKDLGHLGALNDSLRRDFESRDDCPTIQEQDKHNTGAFSYVEQGGTGDENNLSISGDKKCLKRRHRSNNDNCGHGVRGGRRSSRGGDDQMTRCVPVPKTKRVEVRMKRLKKSDILVQLDEVEDQKKYNSQEIAEHKQARSNGHKVSNQKSPEERETDRTETRSVSEQPAAKRPRPAPVQFYQPPAQDDDIQEVVPVKAEPWCAAVAPVMDNSGYGAAGQSGAVAQEETYAEDNYDYGGYDAEGYDDGSGMIDPNTGMPLAAADGIQDPIYHEIEIESRYYRDGCGQFQCTECDYASKHRATISRHIEARHVSSPGYQCCLCDKFCSTRHALSIHNSRNHKK